MLLGVRRFWGLFLRRTLKNIPASPLPPQPQMKRWQCLFCPSDNTFFLALCNGVHKLSLTQRGSHAWTMKIFSADCEHLRARCSLRFPPLTFIISPRIMHLSFYMNIKIIFIQLKNTSEILIRIAINALINLY